MYVIFSVWLHSLAIINFEFIHPVNFSINLLLLLNGDVLCSCSQSLSLDRHLFTFTSGWRE